MRHSNPINFVYLIALAVASVVTSVYSLYTSLIFGLVVGMVFLISLSIVSMIDKISDNHVRFIMYSLISVTMITIIKVALSYFQEPFLVFAAEKIELAVIPTLIIGVYPIYFESTLTTQNYFVRIVIIAFTWLLFAVSFGTITEMIGYGTLVGKALIFEGMEFFKQPYGGFFIIATIAIIFNIIRRMFIKGQNRLNTRVNKYRFIIKEIRRREDIQSQSNQGGNK